MAQTALDLDIDNSAVRVQARELICQWRNLLDVMAIEDDICAAAVRTFDDMRMIDFKMVS